MAWKERIAGVDPATSFAARAAGDLIISEIVEGSGNNKAVELYNGNGAAIDLAAADYGLEIYFNGSASPGFTVGLEGTVAAGQTFVFASSAAAAEILAVANQTSGAGLFNGNDAIVLTRAGAVVDSFGQVGVDPGSEWDGGGLNDTLRRVTAPDTDSGDAFDASEQWQVFATDDFSGLGSFGGVSAPAPVINEFVFNHTGADTNEFVEIQAGTGANLSALTLIEIEGDATGSGTIDGVWTLGAADAAGFWTTGFLANEFENGTVTLLLVEGFTGSLGDDLDADDDGVVDPAPWSAVLDGVAVSDGGAGDLTYAETVLAADFDGGSLTVGGASRIPDGTDTDSDADWVRNDFDLAGIDGFAGTPEPGEALNTPGAANATVDDGGGGGERRLISAIQGAGRETPLSGQTVTVEAIVVGDFVTGLAAGDNGLGGFYLQEEDADADGDAMTSEGLFVFAPTADVAIGDLVRVTGTAGEFGGQTQLSNVSSVEVVSNGNALPTAAEIAFPVANLVEIGGALVADLEMYEGMRVTIPQEMTVGDIFNLGRFGEIDLNALGRFPTYTQVEAPDVAGYEAYYAEAARNAVVLDDGQGSQNPSVLPFEIAGEPGRIAGEFDAEDDLNSGDTISGLTGVLGEGFSQYRVQATGVVEFDNTNPRQEAAPEVGGSLTVATFNVLNYFTTLGDEGLTSGPGAGQEPRGADDLIEFQRQTDKLVAALAEIDGDVLGLIEIENEIGDQNGDGEFAIATLVAELNDATGRSYAFVDPGTDYLGGDAIMVGLIYDTQTVKLADDTSVAFLTDADLAGLGLDFGNPVFEGPGTSRVPLAASFEELASGEVFTVAVNHFKSKGSESPFGDNADMGDGAGASNEARLQAAIALDAWLDTDPTGSGDPDVMITGDLNAYAMEDPVQYLIEQGYVNLSAAFTEAGELDYSYGFPLSGPTPQVQGFGILDYALASRSLFDQVTGADHWHINADEASALDYDTTFGPDDQDADLYAPDPFRSSDHDPILVGLDLQSRELVLGRVGSGPVFGTDAAEIIDGQGGRSDLARGFGGSDIFRITDIEGERDKLIIADYEVGLDLIDLNGEVVVDVRELGSNVRLGLGDDGDYILVRGVGDVFDLTFVDDLFVA